MRLALHSAREQFDMAFNFIFLIELLLNVWSCGGPYKNFWSSGWNIFDFIVVATGVLLMSGAIPPGSPLGNLKMMRAFRVFRLFKRIKSLNKVIMALLKAIPGVTNAFVIMVIFMMIYAILAVEYFAPIGQEFGPHPPGTYVTYGDEINGVSESHTIDAMTPRGFIYGWEYYGTFTRALFTLFQVMTGESWSEVVARPLLFGFDRNAVVVAIFFVSFILLTQIVLTNVIVAVLLDKFVEDPDASDEPKAPPTQIDASDFLGADDGESASPTGRSPSPQAASYSSFPVPSNSEDGSLPQLPFPTASPLSNAVSASEFQSKSSDEKLTVLLLELTALRQAVGRCEVGLAELKGDASVRGKRRQAPNGPQIKTTRRS